MKSVLLFLLIAAIPLLSFAAEPSLHAIKGTYWYAQEPAESHEDHWFAMDKFLHVAASASITGLSYHVYHCQYNNPRDRSIHFSLSLAGASGIGKELYDSKVRKTYWSWKDIVADGVGIGLGYLFFIHGNRK